MAYRNRLIYTDEFKATIWSKYKAGESLWSIARSIDSHLKTACVLKAHFQINLEVTPANGIDNMYEAHAHL